MGDYMKHRQHLGGGRLTDGCMKVGEAPVLDLTQSFGICPLAALVSSSIQKCPI